MGCVERIAAIKRAAFALLTGGLLAVSVTANAWASAGCDAVNNGELDVSASTSTPMASHSITGKRFAPGDVLTTTSRTNDGSLGLVYLVFTDGSQRSAQRSNPPNFSTFTLTAAGNESSIIAYIYNNGSGGGSNWITVTCTPGPANASLTEIQSSGSPSIAGQSVTFTATMTGTASNGTPNGTVTFDFGDGTAAIPVTLSGGTASISHTYATAGNKTVTANYGGDSTNYVASSASMTQTVNKVTSSPGLNITPSPAVVGQASTFSVTVSGASGVPAPTGTATINFGDGSSNAVLPLSSGTASTTHTYAAAGNFTVSLTYSGDTNYANAAPTFPVTVSAGTSGTTIGSSANPSPFGQSVTFTATVTGTNPTGTVQFFDGATLLGSGIVSAGSATFSTSALSAGPHSITAVYGGDANNNGSTSSALSQTISLSTTTTTLASSQNPSDVGKPVTFTASVTSGAGAPNGGTVTFMDGATTLGSASVSAGVATLTTSALALGSHTITASYSGSPGFTSGTSSPLVQSINIPADSLKLRALQAMVTPMVSQFSGQAISGAIDNAISEGLSDSGGSLVAPNSSGIRFNFSADSNDDPKASAKISSEALFGTAPDKSRVNDAFSALAYAAPTKAPPRFTEAKEWLGWAEVRGTTLDRSGNNSTGTSALYGNQINVVAGLTRKLAPNFLIGAFGGYETFDYRSDQLQGRMKGDGWTVGSYLGWKITQTIRFDAAVGYSGLGYDGTAGTASGSFTGNRWLVSGGLTGRYETYGLMIEPSARIYALWEHENAYTDTLGTVQTARDFTTGRASAGLRLAYPVMWSSVAVAPYVGLYGDYYFNGDTAAVPAASLATVSAAILDGWSARAAGGANLKFTNGAQISIGAERGGIGSSSGAALWTYRARASVPF